MLTGLNVHIGKIDLVGDTGADSVPLLSHENPLLNFELIVG